MHACGYFITKVSVLDKTVSFYLSISGESWSIVLKNSTGAVEASKGGSGYGYFSLIATSYGPHTLELTCNWNTENPCEICSVDISQPGGSISFVSTPPGAGIFIDGADQGAITPNTVSSIPVGTHVFTLKLAGYNDYTGSIDVVLNQTSPVTVTMIVSCTPVWKCELPLTGNEADGCGNWRANPACNPPQTGNISFVSTPAGAEIFIDGADQNITTPATIYNIPVGTHTYTLKQTGYNDVTRTANVGLNQTVIASATLIPVARPGIGTGTIMAIVLAAGALGAIMYRKKRNSQ